jgi:mannose-6-phosphate isomerase-like protein (cupin superfamily)
MAVDRSSELITYADSSALGWTEFRPGSRRKILAEDPKSGRLVMLVQWDAGYRMEAELHQLDEHLYILEGTYIDQNRASGPGTYICNPVGSEHRAYTLDGCTFLEIVPGS